jgi:hypothetical protein
VIGRSPVGVLFGFLLGGLLPGGKDFAAEMLHEGGGVAFSLIAQYYNFLRLGFEGYAAGSKLGSGTRDQGRSIRAASSCPPGRFERADDGEHDASAVRTFDLELVPGLLQTEAYARPASPWMTGGRPRRSAAG